MSESVKNFFQKKHFSWNAFGHVACCYAETAEKKLEEWPKEIDANVENDRKKPTFPEK